jgi:SAM-dependent methyltransferase
VNDLRNEYDAWHEQHPTGSGPWYVLVWDALQRRRLLPGARVLEIGCGAGDFAARMAEGGARSVIGQDFAPVAVDRAIGRFRQENLSFEVGDIESIRYPRDHFDVVVSCETVEHVAHPRRAISELARVLRPGGTLLLTTPNYMSLTGLHRLYRDATARRWDEGGQPLVHWTCLPRTVRWLRSSGMKIEQIDGDGWYMPIPRRPGGYAWNPPAWGRAALVPFALHQLLVARHRATRWAVRRAIAPR